MSAQGANYSSQAATARANAIAQRQQAYANAYKLETDAASQSYLAADNMMTMRRNQTAAVDETRLANGASGFDASGGSKLQAEQSVADVFEQAIANMMKSNTISDQNTRMQANAYRRQGDTSLNLGNIQADYLNRMSSINRKYSKWALVGSGLSTLGQLGMKYNWKGSGGTHPANQLGNNITYDASGIPYAQEI